MKKLLVIVISVVLVLAVPLSASAGSKSGTTKEANIKEVTATVSKLPEIMTTGDMVEITITVPRSGSSWEYGETSGLTDIVTVFDEETCEYITTAYVDTSAAGSLDIVLEFNMKAGKSRVLFQAVHKCTVDITGGSKSDDKTYFWNQDFSTGADGWSVGAITGTVMVSDGTALLKPGMTGGGSYSFFEESSGDWTGNWYASIKTYIDPAALESGEGFDYIVAINSDESTVLNDYGFTAMSDGATVSISCINIPGTVSITKPGWYELRHFFYDDAGMLSVEMNVFAPDGSAILTQTVNTAHAVPTDVGSARYGWFTSLTITDGLLIDDFVRYSD